jgi:hypothetical protein
MEVHTNSNVDWYPTFVDNSETSYLIVLRKLDYISNGTYNSTGDANFDLATDGTITKSGSGTATNVTDSDYQSHTRDFGEWSRPGPNGYYYLQDTNRYGAFVGTVTRSASFNASQEPPITISAPTYSGDPKVRVWGTLYAEGSDHVGSTMYLDDHSGGNYYAKIEADLNGIPLVVFESIPLPEDYQYPSNPYGGGIVGTANVIGAAYVGGLMGELQGTLNIVNGIQDVGVGILNLSSFLSNPVMHVPIESWDWSRGVATVESGTPGGWDDTHGWSKFIGGESAVSLITVGVSKLATAATAAGNGARLTEVSRWGRAGLENRDWVQLGGKTPLNYFLTFKWQPGLGNQFAHFKDGQSFLVSKSDLIWPKGLGVDGWWKGLFGQRIYVGIGL